MTRRKLSGCLLYNLFLLPLFPLLVLVSFRRHLRRGGARRDFLKRLGLLPDAERSVPPGAVWIQALSVGEAPIARTLTQLIEKEISLPVFLTTTTVTGFRTIRRLLPEVPLVYFPFDLPFVWPSFLRRYKPRVFISLETEFWPNLLYALDRKKIPAFLLNGRLSPISFFAFSGLVPVVAPALSVFSRIGMRSRPEAARMVRLGAAPEKVSVTGSIKYDAVFDLAASIDPVEAGRELGLEGRAVVFGSLHAEEEAAAVEVSTRLLADFPDVRVVLTPRYLEHTGLERALRRQGLDYRRFSSSRPPAGERVLLLDVMGRLNKAYACGSAAFVGGSLTIFGEGGHNLAEPAAFGKPVAFGPHIWNFQEEADLLLEAGGGVRVDDAGRLYAFFARCLSDPAYAAEAGARAYRAMRGQTGAAKRSLEMIRSALFSK